MAASSWAETGQAPAFWGNDEHFVAESAAFLKALKTARQVAARQSAVLLCGESGTGKEVVARHIHALSPRSARPFVPVDCANLSGDLLASELFGHVRGAFTGAERDTLGFFRAADGGTIFLDEVSELDLAVQARLLRVLQEGQVTPVGSPYGFPIDVRVICATNQSLEDMVRRGTFREDLYYRIHVVRIDIPPLRERTEAVLPLASHFLDRQAELYDEERKRLSPDAEQCLLRHHWPGNVRELGNAMEHAYVLTEGEQIPAEALPWTLRGTADAEAAGAGFPTLDTATKRLIQEALEHTGGKKMQAARLLGIERRRLGRLIKRLGIDPRHPTERASAN